jgi:hypothetical protein
LGGHFELKQGGHFGLESGGQFAPKWVVILDWNWVVNLTVFSTDNSNSENQVGSSPKQENEVSKVAGIEITDLLKIYNDLKDSLTDAEFQAILGIVLSLGTYKELIKPTQGFISTKIEKELPKQ